MEKTLNQQGEQFVDKFNAFRASMQCAPVKLMSVDDNPKYRLIYLNCIIHRLITILRIPVLSDSRDENTRRAGESRVLITEATDWLRLAGATLNMVPQIDLRDALALYKKYHCTAFMSYTSQASIRERMQIRQAIVSRTMGDSGAASSGKYMQRYWHKNYLTGIKNPVFTFEEQLPKIKQVTSNTGISNESVENFNLVHVENDREYPREVSEKAAANTIGGPTAHPAMIGVYNNTVNAQILAGIKKCNPTENVVQGNILSKITYNLPYIKYMECKSNAELIDRVVADCREIMVMTFIDSSLPVDSYLYREQYTGAMAVVVDAVGNLERFIKQELQTAQRNEPRAKFPIAADQQQVMSGIIKKVINNALAKLGINRAQQVLERVICK